jgi:hypothetical protein
MARYPLFSSRCARCSHEFTAPQVTGPYGELGARSTGRGTLLAVHALEDQVFGEVAAIAAQCMAEARVNLSDRERGHVTQIAWSAACDPDEDGTLFVIGAKPRCPACGSASIDMHAETGEFAELDLPAPAYSTWHTKTGPERAQAIRAAVMEALSA